MDRSEEILRTKILNTDPRWKTFKEGVWLSPKKGQKLQVVATYEAKGVNVSEIGGPTLKFLSIEEFNEDFKGWTHVEPYKGAY